MSYHSTSNKPTEPGRSEYEAWNQWISLQENRVPWGELDDEMRTYWVMVEKENGRGG